MKTVKQWSDKFREYGNPDIYLPDADIEAIQQDAYVAGLQRAAQVCRERIAEPINFFPAARPCDYYTYCSKAIEAEAKNPLP